MKLWGEGGVCVAGWHEPTAKHGAGSKEEDTRRSSGLSPLGVITPTPAPPITRHCQGRRGHRWGTGNIPASTKTLEYLWLHFYCIYAHLCTTHKAEDMNHLIFWNRQILLSVMKHSQHLALNKPLPEPRTDGQTDRRTRWYQYTPLSTSLKWGV